MPPSTNAVAATAAADGGVSSATRNPWVKGDFLFETLLCDLSLTALSVGAYALLLQARAKSDAKWTLEAWGQLFGHEGEAMRLALRFRTEMGLSESASARIAGLYTSLRSRKGAAASHKPNWAGEVSADRPAKTQSVEEWRRLCREAASALRAVAPETKQRLPAAYDEDNRMLIGFLEEAAKGDTRRVGAFGEILLPKLRQRRRSPRASVSHSCTLVLPDGRVTAEIEDVSRNGLGVCCRQPMREGQDIVVELSDGRQLSATVARSDGDHIGLRLITILSMQDPLFRR